MANIHIQRFLKIDNQVICEIDIHKEICDLLLLKKVYLWDKWQLQMPSPKILMER
jgi:hypothetical protein